MVNFIPSQKRDTLTIILVCETKHRGFHYAFAILFFWKEGPPEPPPLSVLVKRMQRGSARLLPPVVKKKPDPHFSSSVWLLLSHSDKNDWEAHHPTPDDTGHPGLTFFAVAFQRVWNCFCEKFVNFYEFQILPPFFMFRISFRLIVVPLPSKHLGTKSRMVCLLRQTDA